MSFLKPTYMANSVFSLHPEKLKLMGITHVLSDLDNTLIPWNENKPSSELVNWVQELKKYHIELIVVSNNNYMRIHEAVSSLDIQIVARAKKPLPFAIKKFVGRSTINKKRVLFVGDQLLTDVIAGNLAGVKTVMVKPLIETDLKKTRFNRLFERPLLKLINKLYKQTWKDSI